MARLFRAVAVLVLCLWPLIAPAQDQTAQDQTAQDQTAQELQDSGYISNFIANNLSGVSRSVIISGFDGALSSRATIRVLTVADDTGVWLRLEGLTLDWNRAALLSGAIDITELSADQITIFRAPVSSATIPSPEAVPFALPDLPISVNIETLNAAQITLGAPLLGEEVNLEVTGKVALSNGEGTAELLADRIGDQAGQFALTGSYSNITRILGLNLSLTEAADGIVARLLNLPGRPSVALTLTGTAPIDDYVADLSIATDGAERISGTVGLSDLPDPDGGPSGRGFALDVRGDVTPLLAPDYRDFFGTDVQLVVQGEQDGTGATSLSALQITTAALSLAGTADIAATGWPERIALKGQIGTEGGDPVLLPVAGAATTVQAMTLDVQFDAAQGNSWTGDFALTDFNRPGLRIPALTLSGGGVIAQTTTDTPGQFSADLAYAATGIALADAGLARALGNDLSGRISLARTGGGPFQINTLTLQGPGIEADVQGTIQGPADGFEIQSTIHLIAADATRFDLLTGLGLGGAADVRLVSTLRPLDGIFDLILTGQTTDLALGIGPLDPLLRGAGAVTLTASRDTTGTRISDLTIATPALSGTGQADLTNGVSTATFDLNIADIGLSLPGLTGPAQVTGQANRDPQGAIAADLSATLPGAQAILTAMQAAGGPFMVELFSNIPDLSAFAPLAGLPLSGAANAGLNGTFAPDTGQIDLALTANSTDLELGIAQLDPLLAGAGTITGMISGTGISALSLDGLTVTTAGLTGAGSASLQNRAIAADFDLNLPDASLSVPGLTGPAALRGTVSRAATGDSTVDLSASLMGADAIISLMQTMGAAIKVEGFADLADLSRFSTLARTPLRGAATLGLTGTIQPDQSLLDLTLSGTSSDIGLGLAQLDPLLAGDGRLAGRLLRDGPDGFRLEGATFQTPALTATASGNLTDGAAAAAFDVSVPQIGLVAPGVSGPARVQGTAQRQTDGAASVNLSANGPGATVQLSASQPAGAAVLETDLIVNIANLAPYAALAGQRLSGGIDGTVRGTLALDISQFDLTLAAQTRDLDPGNAAAARLLRGAGSVAGQFSRDPDQGGLQVQGLQVRFPNLNLSGDLDGRDGAGTARFDARLTDIGIFTPEFSGPVTATGTAQRDVAGNWQVDTQATGPGGTNAAIAGQIGRQGQLDLTARGSAPLGLVNGAIEPRRISGTAGFDLALQGQAAVSALSGNISLSDARLTDPVLLKAISGIGGTITLANGQATVNLTGGLQGGGGVRLSGGVGLAAPFVANLEAGLDAIVLRDPNLYETTASGTLTVTGPLTGPLTGGGIIAGLIELGPTEVQVPSSGVSALGDLPVVLHLNTPADVQQTLDRAGLTGQTGASGGGESRGGFALNVTIRAPGRVFIRGRGLDAELGGQVVLGGTTRAVIPSGQFDLVRGRLSILQQRFELTEGSATLQGNFVPVIRLVARTTARTGTVINISVDGPISEPSVTFGSVPELPQDEVLAQLIFGRDLSAITPLQAVQLAAAVGTLAGRGGGGLIEGFRTGLGVDDFDVTSDAAGNAALRVGKYLGENLYTDVTISSGTTEVNLNLDLTEDLTVKGSVSSDGDTGLGIFFERDY